MLTEEENRHLYWNGLAMARFGNTLVQRFQTVQHLVGTPWFNLVAQLLQQNEERMDSLVELTDDPRGLNQLVRRAATQPLLLTVEYLHWADSPWLDLLYDLADEIAQDLPVLMILTVDAPAPVIWLTEDMHSAATRVAATLVLQHLAQAFHLGEVSAEDCELALQTTSVLADRLVQLAGGDPWIVQMLWDEWQRQSTVVRQATGIWHLAQTQHAQWLVFGDTRDYVRNLVQQLLKRHSEPPFDVRTVETILNCAAVEGEVFTVQAVAEVLGIDEDDLIDFLDDYLCSTSDTNGLRTEPILEEYGFVEVPQRERELFQYRFSRPYLHHVFAKYPARPDDRRRWSGQIAEMLEYWYSYNASQIADKLYRLFTAADMEQRAAKYKRTRTVPSDITVLLWHTQFLVERVDHNSSYTYRLLEVGFELCQRISNEFPELWERGYELARRLSKQARKLNDREHEANALFYAAYHLVQGNQIYRALPLADSVVAHYHSLAPNGPDEARGLWLKGIVLRAQGEVAAARACLERALGIAEAVDGPAHWIVAATLTVLGDVLRD